MNEPLHPLTLSEILDRTAQLYRSRFLLFLGIATIPAGTLFLFAAGIFGFMAWMGVNSRHGASVADIFVWVFLSVLLIVVVPGSLVTSALGEAAMTDAAARYFLGETATTIRTAYKTAWKRGWRYMGLFVLQGLAIIIAPAAGFVLAVIAMIAGRVSGYANNDQSPLFGGLVFLLILVLASIAVWILLRLCLAFPASVLEDATAWHALKRAAFLSNGTRGRIFVLYLLGLFLNQILAWAVTIPAIIVLALIPGLQGQAHTQTLGMIMMFVVYGSAFAVRALTKPVYGIALTLFYFDQRIRKEGFDIEWMMLCAGMVPAAPGPEHTVVGLLPTHSPAVPEPSIVSTMASEPGTIAAAATESITDLPSLGELPR